MGHRATGGLVSVSFNFLNTKMSFVMDIRDYLLESFLFNDQANRNMIKKIALLPRQEEAVRHVSHLINSQNKWMARIMQSPDVTRMSWWDPVYAYDRLEPEWENSLRHWLDLIEDKPDGRIEEEVEFTGFDGARWAARFLDIALQLIYHSVHHRAQIQQMIRSQGLEPDFIDYIGTKYRRIGT
jgi:uncharacterized damage-inducible protein DinB